MKHITANTAQKDFFALLNDITHFNEPVTVVSDDSKAVVLLSIEEWNAIQETLYLQSIPGMVESIKTAFAEPLTKGVSASEVDFGV
jgi:prevent-host-death family protein